MSRARVPIDPEAWYIAVGSSHPGGAGATKGGVVHPLKAHVSWVQYGASQYGIPCWERKLPEGKVLQVREERSIGASGHRLSDKATPGSYALADKS